MKAPNHISLIRQTADILEDEITSGRWTTTMPGERILSKDLGISRKTLQKALSILTRRNLLLPAEQGKKRKINPTRKTSQATSNTLVILSSKPYNQHNETIGSILNDVQKLLIKKKWSIEILTIIPSQLSAEGFPKLIDGKTSDRWLLVSPNRELIELCAAHQLRIISLGGEGRAHPSPSVGIPVEKTVIHATKQLLSIGHRRIAVVIPKQSPSSRADHSQLIKKEFDRHQLIFSPAYNLPLIEENTPTSVWELLENLFKLSPPTALILHHTDHYITALSFFAAHGLRSPQDVSRILITGAAKLKWFFPRPAHYDANNDKFVRTICRWVEHYPADEPGVKFLPSKCVEADSVAPPK